MPKKLWGNYLSPTCRRPDVDSLFIVDLKDMARPYAKKMENIALVRDTDKGCLVASYWCMEVYTLDRDRISWPRIIWPYRLEAEGRLSEMSRCSRYYLSWMNTLVRVLAFRL